MRDAFLTGALLAANLAGFLVVCALTVVLAWEAVDATRARRRGEL